TTYKFGLPPYLTATRPSNCTHGELPDTTVVNPWANGPCFSHLKSFRSKFSKLRQYCGQVVAADGVKTDGSAASDELVVRMGHQQIFIRHFLFLWRDYSRNANVNKQFPALTATYCLPPTEYVIGPDMTAAPRDVFHSSAPLRASRA